MSLLPRFCFLYLVVFCSFLCSIQAETFYLKNGETIKGKLRELDKENMLIESEQGFGTLQIPRNDLNMVEFPGSKLEMARLYGVGYRQHQNTINDVVNYNTDQGSLKVFLDNELFVQAVYSCSFPFVNISTK